MTFEKFVCWDLEKVRRAMDVEATQPAKHLFLATHHPISMYRQELINESDAVKIKYDEKQFLKDFLAQTDFAFVPVLGNSGTGKSHLIRWLEANIESTDKRKVLLIPKIGTNLKDIITLILEGMEGAKFDEYRQRVNRATNTLTQNQARVQLLNQLAAAVGDNSKRDKTELTDEQIYLVEELDSLLYDPFFREYWLKDSGIIHRLVIHILGYTEKIEIIEERRELSVEDLPLDISNLQKAGTKAQQFYAFLLGDKKIQKATVDWLNQHLDEAITQVLNLGREDLLRLIREVRETLAEQNIELVLLIEDFAKLQGIDREVLEAVLARPQQPGSKPLCRIRTALACTTGYFKGLISTFDTVKQRVTFSVKLDVGAVNNQSLMTQADVQEFISRYLNAIRLEDKIILNWANNKNQEEDFQDEPLISACNNCEHRRACHAGFGEVNNVGLYPFNSIAIQQMITRVNPENFNPRIIIKDVLKYTLEVGFNDIRKGCFPTVSLSKHFGSMRLDAMLKRAIDAQDPQNYDRRIILIDLWTNSDKLCDLPSEVHTAFNLRSLGVNVYKTEVISLDQKPQKLTEHVVEDSPKSLKEEGSKYKINTDNSNNEIIQKNSDSLAKKLKLLDDWNNEAMLDQNFSQELRVYIFAAIENKIDWDSEILLKGYFVGGGGKIFQRKNIVFHSPRLAKGHISGVTLSLPLNPDDPKEFRDTAIAFQGILQYNYYKSWKFPNGDSYFRIYSKQLETWSNYVLNAIRRYPRETGEAWNPVPAAVELLALAATMDGHATNSLESLINSIFLKFDKNNDTTRTQSWKRLNESLKKHRVELLEIVQSRIACTKGNSNDYQIVDSTQLIDSLENIRKNWQPQCDIPIDIINKCLDNRSILSDYSKLCKVRKDVDELLEKAIEEEYTSQLNIYKSLISELGEDINKKEVIDAIKTALDKAQDAGVLRSGKSADEITKIIDQFRRTAITKYQDTMKRAQAEKEIGSNSSKIIQYLSEDYQKVITDSQQFLFHAQNFLNNSILEAKNRIADLEQSAGGSIDSCHQGIKEGLANLQSLINEIKG